MADDSGKNNKGKDMENYNLDKELKLLALCEGKEVKSYKDSLGNVTVGIGFNMDNPTATRTWDELKIEEDFQSVYDGNQELSYDSIDKLTKHIWEYCEKQALKRCKELEVDYNGFNDFKRYMVKDLAYNIGSVKKYKKVFLATDDKEVAYEGRRKPYDLLDSRVKKICDFYDVEFDI